VRLTSYAIDGLDFYWTTVLIERVGPFPCDSCPVIAVPPVTLACNAALTNAKPLAGMEHVIAVPVHAGAVLRVLSSPEKVAEGETPVIDPAVDPELTTMNPQLPTATEYVVPA
jgi:hypothetical protein